MRRGHSRVPCRRSLATSWHDDPAWLKRLARTSVRAYRGDRWPTPAALSGDPKYSGHSGEALTTWGELADHYSSNVQHLNCAQPVAEGVAILELPNDSFLRVISKICGYSGPVWVLVTMMFPFGSACS